MKKLASAELGPSENRAATLSRPSEDRTFGQNEMLGTVLHRTAAEARRLAEALGRLDAYIGHSAELDMSGSTSALQEADLTRQEAEGLAEFLAQLAENLARGGNCDAVAVASSLTLAAQASRLLGEAAAPSIQKGPQADLWLD